MSENEDAPEMSDDEAPPVDLRKLLEELGAKAREREREAVRP